MKILKNHEINIDEWKALLSESRNASPFQSRELFQLYNSIPGMKAEAFAVKEAGKLISLCVVTMLWEKGLKSFFTRRAIVYGGPVYITENEKALEFLLKSIWDEFKNNSIYIEVRNYSDYSNVRSVFEDLEWEWLPYLNMKISLKNKKLDEIIGLMKYNRRREIRITIDEGAYYREAKNIQEVEKLYLILRDLYSGKLRLPIPAFDFFRAMFYSVRGKIFIVIHKENIIGGSFCFYQEGKAIYTMYYCGVRDYSRKIFPSHLSVLAAIDFGIKEKLDDLDFMGVGLKGENYGVRQYKGEFGTETKEEGRFRKVNNRLLFEMGKIGLRILKIRP
jgi:serine/alanine adding enzyme